MRFADFGAAGDAAPESAEPAYAVVSYFGTDVRVLADDQLLELDLEEFMEEAALMDDSDPRALGHVRAFLRRLIHPEDFAAFWNVVRERRQDVTAQMAFARHIVEAMTDHPTERQSDSSDGLPSTEPSSVADLSDRVLRRLEDQGRPDLAVAVIQARAHATG